MQIVYESEILYIGEASTSTATQESRRRTGRGRGRGRERWRGRWGGRARTVQTSSILWLATTPESDQAVAATPFLGSPGPQLDHQPVDYFEQIVDDDILQLIATETNRCRNRFRDLRERNSRK